jgi:hypothetical protein
MDEYEFENMSEYLRTQIICDFIKKGEMPVKLIPKKYFNDVICNKLIDISCHFISDIPKSLRTREICLKVPYIKMQYFPDEVISEIALSAVKEDPVYLRHIPEHLRTKEICLEAVKSTRSSIHYNFVKKFIPQQFQEICQEYFDNFKN